MTQDHPSHNNILHKSWNYYCTPLN